MVLGSVGRGKGGGVARRNREWQTLSIRRRSHPKGSADFKGMSMMCSIVIKRSATVSELKALIEETTGMNVSCQVLNFDTITLHGNIQLVSYGITTGANIILAYSGTPAPTQSKRSKRRNSYRQH